MSATTVTVTTGAPEETHSMTGRSGGGTGPPGISPSSSLLFGFLVTFLALFVAFMACGLGTRRARDMRRRMVENAQLNLTRPEMWDVWIGDLKDGGTDWKWRDLQVRIVAHIHDICIPLAPSSLRFILISNTSRMQSSIDVRF